MGGNKKTKVNANLLLVEQSLSTLIRKKKIHSITGIPFTFLFYIPTPLHIQKVIHVVFVMAFHIQKYNGKLLRYYNNYILLLANLDLPSVQPKTVIAQK